MPLRPLLALVLLACKDDPTPPPDPFDDVVLDTTAWVDSPTATMAAHGATVVADRVVVLLDDPVADPAPLAVALGATIDGRVPAIGLVVLGLDAGDEAALDAALTLAAAEPGVAGAVPDMVAHEDYDPAACDVLDDFSVVVGTDRCALDDLHYDEAVTIFDAIRAELAPVHVRVAVIERGLFEGSEQFDHLPIYNLASPGQRLTDPTGHGTTVVGLIAAGEGDAGVRGLVEATLPGQTEILLGPSLSFAEDQAMIARAASAGARVVNMSRSYDTRGFVVWSVAYQLGWSRTFAEHPDVLFVSSAGNDGRDIGGMDSFPGGVDAPNHLTIGGTAHCNPTQAWSQSNWGAPVDLAAPGHDVPVLPYDTTAGMLVTGAAPILWSGTSYSAPMVTSIAAMLWSLAPGLSVADVRKLLTENIFPTAATVSGRRTSLTMPVLQHLVDVGTPSSVTAIINDDDLVDQADLDWLAVDRICGGARLSVDGHEPRTFRPTVEEEPAVLLGDVLAIGLNTPDDEVVATLMTSRSPLPPGDELGIPGDVQIGWMEMPYDGGSGRAGFLRVRRCRIVGRDLLTEAPLSLTFEGEVDGELHTTEGYPPVEFDRAFELSFNLLVVNPLPTEASTALIEAECLGGRDR
jgi:hypothetical protein